MSYAFSFSNCMSFPPPSFIRIQQIVYVLCVFLFELHELPPSTFHPHATNRLCLQYRYACFEDNFPSDISSLGELRKVEFVGTRLFRSQNMELISSLSGLRKVKFVGTRLFRSQKMELISSLGGLRKVEFVGARLFRSQKDGAHFLLKCYRLNREWNLKANCLCFSFSNFMFLPLQTSCEYNEILRSSKKYLNIRSSNLTIYRT